MYFISFEQKKEGNSNRGTWLQSFFERFWYFCKKQVFIGKTKLLLRSFSKEKLPATLLLPQVHPSFMPHLSVFIFVHFQLSLQLLGVRTLEENVKTPKEFLISFITIFSFEIFIFE